MIYELLGKSDRSTGFYRANLHCHSTLSDGALTPEELKELYVRYGYSVIAYTDHNVFITHNELTDAGFLALNGYETNVEAPAPRWDEATKTCHICYVALDEKIRVAPTLHRTKYIWGKAADNACRAEWGTDYERVYSHQGINDAMRLGRDSGFFVTYNHPAWSLEYFPDYSGYTEMNAFEIVNGGCLTEGCNDSNERIYDELANIGTRCFIIATDDNHNRYPEAHTHFDSLVGSTVIEAEKLEYDCIAKALKNGKFYCSTGKAGEFSPEIRYLTYDSEKRLVHIETSDAYLINLITDTRACGALFAEKGGKVNSADFVLSPRSESFRLDIRSSEGYYSYTNRYYLDGMN